MDEQLTLAEQRELEQINAQLAALDAAKKSSTPRSTFDDVKDRLTEIGKGMPGAMAEAAAASVAQKVAAPLAPATLGLSVPIAGGLAALAAHEATQRAQGIDPTLRSRAAAFGMGAIPFAPEARLAAGALKPTAAEIGEAALKQGLGTVATQQGAKAIAGEGLLTPQEAATYMTLAGAGGAAARMAGSGTAGRGEATYVGPSRKAAQEAERKAQNVNRDDALATWQAVGGVTDPVEQNPSLLTKEVERTAGGTSAVKAALRSENEKVATDIFRSEVGFPSNKPLNQPAIIQRRHELNQAYEALKDVDPKAEEMIRSIQSARVEASKAWNKWNADRNKNRASDPELLDAAKIATKQVEAAENVLAKVVKKNAPERYDNFMQARKQLAKLHVGEAALNKDSGVIDPIVIGKIHESAPAMLTDGMRLVGEVANIQPSVMGEFGRETSSMGMNAAIRGLPYAAIGLGSTLAHQAGMPPSLTAAVGFGAGALGYMGRAEAAEKALQFVRQPAVQQTGAQLSPAFLNYQRGYGLPQYQTNVPTNLGLFLSQTGRALTNQPQVNQ